MRFTSSQSTCIQDDFLRISFDSGPSVACLGMPDDVLLSIYSWDKMICSVHEHDFESP